MESNTNNTNNNSDINNINNIVSNNSLNKIELLNSKLLEFLSYLKNVIRNMINKSNNNIKNKYYNVIVNNIKSSQSQIKMSLMYNNESILDLFEQNILQYKSDILKKNDYIIEEIQDKIFGNKINLYSVWENINIEDKTIIWKYLNVFILLSE